ncbi:zinc ribbon domain-containing protein [Variovorax sp. PAMC26660]|uniref:zinc ribbon domain-containing protein n=1 Tax=Variovorax sp. PAMC26660 TaxID=2762322 RepID=UPI0028FC92D1|nr:zinc ribbon domain-containing protein [Variovorax sp. PAMC26660]
MTLKLLQGFHWHQALRESFAIGDVAAVLSQQEREKHMGMLERLFGGHGGGRHGGGGGHHGSSGGYGGYGNGAPPANGGGDGGGGACPACRTANAPGARFCQQCGTSMLPAACGKCGTTMQAGAKFCGQCGQSSEAASRV